MNTNVRTYKALFTALAIGIISGACVIYLSIGSGTKVIAWGDSLTFGVGAQETGGYTKILNDDGYNVLLRGFPGQTSTEIAINQGAIGVRVFREVGSDFLSAEPDVMGDFRKRKEIVFKGDIEGSPVSLTRFDNGKWKVSGDLLNKCPNTCKFTSSNYVNQKNAKNIIWVGRNNNLKFTKFVYRDISLIVKSLPKGSTFLVIGLTPAQDDNAEKLEAIRKLNDSLKNTYKENFIDMWEELAEVNSGKIPISLYSDHVHFNDDGYRRIARIIENKL